MSDRSRIEARRAFVDTSAYFALFNDKDVDHSRVVAIIRLLATSQARLFTTNFVVAETHAFVLRRMGRSIATSVLHDLDQSATIIVRVSLADERRAREIIDQDADKDFSLTDAMSFAVMRRLRIGRAVTLAAHFAQFGFGIAEAES